MASSRRKKILVAMSGGVDSSVAAALLKEEGHEVFGFTLRVVPCAGDEGDRRCCTAADIEDARAVAGRLGISHRVVDVQEEFRAHVIEPFIRAYASGSTPIPCVPCNALIKFAILLKRARELGADAVATGHYARVVRENGMPRLERAEDEEKDQTYFLFGLTREQLDATCFPLGELTKERVRVRAAELGLPVAAKSESQEVCFIPPGEDVRGFLAARLPPRPGPIVDSFGVKLGEHHGLHFFTVGQRRGLGLSDGCVAAAPGIPLHVLALVGSTNTVVVGPEDELYSPACVVGEAAFREEVAAGEAVTVRIRSRHPGVGAWLEPALAARPSRIRSDQVRVRFASPQRAVTPGQAAVFYRDRRVLGGGTILAAETASPGVVPFGL